MGSATRNIYDETVSMPVLGRILGLSERQISRLISEGTIRRNDRNRLLLGDAVKAYCDKLRQKNRESQSRVMACEFSGDASGDLEAEKTRLTKAQADKQEIAVQILLGKYVPADAVLCAWADLITIMKTAMLNLPNKLAPRLASMSEADEVQQLLEREVTASLESLDDFDLSQVVEHALPEGFDDSSAAEASDSQPVGR